MKTILFLLCFNLVGCIEEENCHETDIVDHYTYTPATDDIYYTVATPVYKEVCEWLIGPTYILDQSTYTLPHDSRYLTRT